MGLLLLETDESMKLVFYVLLLLQQESFNFVEKMVENSLIELCIIKSFSVKKMCYELLLLIFSYCNMLLK